MPSSYPVTIYSSSAPKEDSHAPFLAWLPDSTLFVAGGYNGTRVAKFDKNGKFLDQWPFATSTVPASIRKGICTSPKWPTRKSKAKR